MPDVDTNFLEETKRNKFICNYYSLPHDTSQGATPPTIQASNGEVNVIEDTSDETVDITSGQHPPTSSKPRARSTTRIVTDTNNGEPTEDSTDSSDVSEFSDSSDIASDQRTWAGSRRVGSRPLRVLISFLLYRI